MPPILIIPGWTNSGPDHWQSLWEHDLSQAQRVEQRDWQHPDREEWIATLEKAIHAAPTAPVLVAHSLGCLTVVHWAARYQRPIHGALLVAPPDVEKVDAPVELQEFAPIPQHRLPFRSIVVASRDDPYISFERSRAFATAWGSEFKDAGAAGHINTESGLGAWPEGRRLLASLL